MDGNMPKTGWKRCLVAVAIGIGALFSASNASGQAGGDLDYANYATVLETYVDDSGMVDYSGLKADRERLDAFAGAIGSLSPSVYNAWSDEGKIAFWINAYNALTLKAIIDNYPIKSSFVASLRFPKNSIRQIPGVWDELKFRVMGQETTLDEIEHARLRRNFNEPRIHVALVCAAMGCPPLRNEPFTADGLDAQLDDQTDSFLKNPQKFGIERSEGSVSLSPIFKWFGDDFVKTYGTDAKFAGHRGGERAVLNFVSAYLLKSDAEYLSQREYDIDYFDYNWSLNEQR